jgi:hypothetical protein
MRRLDPEVVVVDDDDASRRLPARKRKIHPGLSSQAAGLIATILFHLAITSPLLLGIAAHKTRHRPADGPSLVAWASEGEQRESMILLDLSAVSANAFDQRQPPDIKTEGIELQDMKLVLVSARIAPPAELRFEDAEEADVSNAAAGDPTGAAAKFGRYMGQIAGRIDRTWMRPRSPVAGGRFDCSARISQDRRGDVLAIEFQQCGDDPRWRHSLESAILRASPLSAPPEPWLFTETVTLNFSGEQYTANVTPEYLYEPEGKHVARAVSPSTVEQTLDGVGDFDLTIVGDEVTWKKK